MSQVHVGRLERAQLSLDVTRRQHASATDFWDGNWVAVDIVIAMGGWQGRYEASLRAEEFERFYAEVTKLRDGLSSPAEFVTMEDWLWLRLEGDGRGHVHVQGRATDQPGVGDTLSFAFDIDQTDLGPLASELREVIEEFPVVGVRP
jgi:hypothetical protein